MPSKDKASTYFNVPGSEGGSSGASNPFEKDPLRIEETLNRIQHHKGVSALLVVNYDGSVLKSNIDNVQSHQYATQFLQLAILARNAVRDLDPENDMQVLRIKTKKSEIMISAGTVLNLNYIYDLSVYTSKTTFFHCRSKSQRVIMKATSNKFVNNAITVSTTFPKDLYGYSYSRQNQPNWQLLEDVLRKIEKAEHALVYGSGMAAIWALLVYVNPKRIIFSGGYHGTRDAFSLFLRIRHQDETKLVIHDFLRDFVLEKHDLLWIESPRNPCCSTYDLKSISNKAREAQSVIIIDSTLAPAPLQRCLELGAHFVMYSMTKIHGGHSDVLGGAIITNDTSAYHTLAMQRACLGNVMGSLESWIFLRSMKTFSLRLQTQSDTAYIIVTYLYSCWKNDHRHLKLLGDTNHILLKEMTFVGEPYIANIYHTSCNQKSRISAHTFVFSLILKTRIMALELLEKLTVFKKATSFGSVDSSVDYRFQHDKQADDKLLRFSVGLESPIELCTDLHRAFFKLAVNLHSKI